MGRFNDFLKEAAEASNTTRLQESLHCVALGIAQKKKNITVTDLMNGKLFGMSFDKFCRVDASQNELYEFAENNESWAASVVKAANALKATKFLKRNDYKFYRGTGFMNLVYAEFSRLKKIDGVKLNNDKWNPGDIWASVDEVLPNFEHLAELNQYISKNIKKGFTVPISLKKVGKSAKVTHEGTGKEEIEIVGYKVIKKPKDIYPTGMVVITTKENIGINFRSFRISKQADVGGEIVMKGGTARHGKVPSASKKEMIDKYKIPQMPKSRIQQYSDEGVRKLIKMVTDLWKQCGYKFSKSEIEKNIEQRINRKGEVIDKKGNVIDATGYWQSILHSLEIGAFLNTHRGVADEIVNAWIQGGASSSDYSSEFIKVY